MSTGSHQSNDLSSMNKSIPELVTFLKHALGESHFKEVQNILVEREEKAKLEIEKLRIENEVLKTKYEVLTLECDGVFSVTNGDENGAGERERSAEEIYNQLVGEMFGGKGEKATGEVGKLKSENVELKRKNAKLRKLMLDCVENYVDWNNKFSSLQRDVTKLKTVEAIGFDGISKRRTGENGENRNNGLSFGSVCRAPDFDVEENFVQTENMVDQGSRTAPVKSAVEIIVIDDDLPRASCEGNMASEKPPISGEHSNQNHASVGQKRKECSYKYVVDLGKDSNLTNRFGGFDIQTDGGNVNKDEESTQTLRQCDGKNLKQRHLSGPLKMPGSGIAQTYDSKDSRDDDLSADWPKKRRQWKLLEDMRTDLSNNKICMSAVCTLYRQHQCACERLGGSMCWSFKSYCFERGMQIAEFLIDGDLESRLRKTEKELQSQFNKGLEDCRFIAKEHSKELFEIYQKKLDPFYPDA